MSHVSRNKLKIEIKDENLLIAVLNQFGQVIRGAEAYVTNWQGAEKTKVDIALRLPNGRQQIGFVWNDKTKSYDFVGDLYIVRRAVNKIQKEYIKNAYIRALRMKGYTVREQGKQLIGVKA